MLPPVLFMVNHLVFLIMFIQDGLSYSVKELNISDEAAKGFGSEFDLAFIMSKRVRVLASGSKPLVSGFANPSKYPILVAIEEINQGKLTLQSIYESLPQSTAVASAPQVQEVIADPSSDEAEQELSQNAYSEGQSNISTAEEEAEEDLAYNAYGSQNEDLDYGTSSDEE